MQEEYIISPDRLPRIKMDEPREGKRLDTDESKKASPEKFEFVGFKNDAAIEIGRIQGSEESGLARRRPKNALAKRIRQRYIKNVLDDRKE